MKYGVLIQDMINFLIIVFYIFLLLKAINKIYKKKEQIATPAVE
ncbi:MAG: MscL family protein [Flavobacteriales bacterium]